MQYRKYGKSEILVSALGMGAMRLPEYNENDKWFIDDKKTQQMVDLAIEKGINYFDCAYGYCHGNCESAMGKALKPYRDRIFLSTKLPLWNVKSTSDFDKIINEQLERLQTDYLDFYHFHAVNRTTWENVVIKHNLMDKMIEYKNKGIIKNISFSFHDKFDLFKEIVDTGIFCTCLLQYNLIDQSNEACINYAAKKGLGVAVMGPLGGGRLAINNEKLSKFIPNEQTTLPQIALRFVINNPNVSLALSGMESCGMIEFNSNVINDFMPMNIEDSKFILDTAKEMEKMADLYCTGCEYCMPCEKEIKIPKVFSIMNNHLVYGLTDLAKEQFREYEQENGEISSCIKCGKCEKKCPQNIKIRERFVEISNVLK